MRSGIGMPANIKKTLQALGLTKRMRTVFVPVSQDTTGMIMKVKELVDVQEVETEKTRREMKVERRPDPGFYVESSSRQSLWRTTAQEFQASSKQSLEPSV